jgi:hypothetical protein
MVVDLMLASYAYFEGGAIGDMLYQWEQAGFFSYLLPFLLIFALIFGILTQIKIFKESKAVNAIIALVVSLMALQFPMVSNFFSEIFPRLGIGLAILLLVLIFIGMFADPDSNAVMWSMLGVGGIIAVIVLIQTAGAVGWSSGWWWYDNWPTVAGAIFILVILGVIVGASNPSTEKSGSILARMLREK